MSWQILIGISVFLYSVSVLLQRFLLKNDENEPISFLIFFQIGVSFVTLALVLIINHKFILPDLTDLMIYLAIMSVLYGFAGMSMFKSLKTTEASQFSVIFSSRTIFAILGSWLLFGEGLNLTQWTGSLFIIMGVIMVSIKKVSVKFGKGELLALTTSVLIGLANVNDRLLVQHFNPFSYVVVGFFLPTLLIILFNPSKLINLKIYFRWSIFYKMMLMCIISSLSAVTLFASLAITTNSSQLFSINAFSGVLTVILSIIFLNEREFVPRKIFGAILSLIGLLLVS